MESATKRLLLTVSQDTPTVLPGLATHLGWDSIPIASVRFGGRVPEWTAVLNAFSEAALETCQACARKKIARKRLGWSNSPCPSLLSGTVCLLPG
ncbi:hypothetical protein NDU88_001598 [Pleurodeles waltl]|uniref:Uncharacterized protein n=1 Tax=Pleurodeles waltl TaxID=8319 RepID=A0AAV7NB73_PLEWA|nr:hypothetical protein NDU88_001587 [Pleurodeles waltl]KAJ1113352.1 hypothetical protein NDU88_001598 [Pleurodeles waltl]